MTIYFENNPNEQRFVSVNKMKRQSNLYFKLKHLLKIYINFTINDYSQCSYPMTLHLQIVISIFIYIFRIISVSFHLILKYQLLQMYKHLNHVGTFPLIPQEAFLFKPQQSQHPNTPDDFKRYEGKVFRRLLFEGWAQQTYTPHQRQHLKAFDNYLIQKGIKLNQHWDNPWKLRFLLSTDFKYDVTIKEMQKFMTYMEKTRDLSFTPIVSKSLHDGLFYIVGRDTHYRPIIVFDVEKIINANLSEEQLTQLQIYFFQYIMRNYFIPGQVESWVAIIDSNYQGFFSLIGTLQNAFAFLSQTYRMRLYCCYNVRINYSIKLVWGIVQKFLDEETVNKIILVEEQVPQELFSFTNRSQVQQKFGGTLPNIKQGHFWPPPYEVSKQYGVQGQNIRLMTREQYTKSYQEKKLYDTKINQDLLILPQSTELRVNNQKKKLKEMQRQMERQWEQAREQTLDTSLAFKYLNTWKKTLNYSNLLTKVYQKNFPDI